ncbi:hypothetical protein Q0Z83_018010 [Actinoplanes sichuanensis]|uniref:Uncharacterized protein n=1 Tax=Actinoplanes sichuanensis TaxID=512349 RepID=A0ABW4A8J1_9ACTN|nr:hypothetical protein [Actinoplanes sichuanensis]BEL03610.1 hypothetical protein Q0Z83_018010 [Actinoplanes sichuanensis]
MLTELLRLLLWRRRVRNARAWREAERRQAAERSGAIQRILDQAVGESDRVRPGGA